MSALIMPTEKEIEKMLEKFLKENTPLPGNLCRKVNCGGQVVQDISSLFLGQLYFRTPRCEKCGRHYDCADKRTVPKVGVKEFLASLAEPVTI